MSLEELAQQLEQKGFTRPATLMRTYYGRLYLTALLQPEWRNLVISALSPELYQQLKQFRRGHPAPCDLFAVLNEGAFRPQEYSLPPLEVKLEHIFDFPTLQKTAEIVSTAAHLVSQAMAPIYREIVLQTKDNDDLLYEVYKDTDVVPEHIPTPEELKNIEEEYRTILSRRVPGLRREAEDPDMLTFIILNEIRLVTDYLPKEEWAEYFDFSGGKEEVLEWFEQDYGGNEEKLRIDAIKLAKRGEEILNSPEKFSAMTLSLVTQQQESKRERVLKNARRTLENDTQHSAEVPYEKAAFDSCLTDFFNPFNPFEVYLNVLDYTQLKTSLGFDPSEERDCRRALREKGLASLCADALQRLYKSSINVRQEFLEFSYDRSLQHLFEMCTGLQQLAEGGTITNPQASPVSVVQNHAQLPNLPYSKETKKALSEIIAQLTPLLSDIPDISDLPASDKLRNKKELTYVMRELPKDPLDVTFGNDSGCCIFVPEKLEGMQNGMYVPEYLLNPHVRLFGLFRQKKNKEQRMGLVVAFEARGADNNSYLVCNSLELSRVGISGGKQTVQKIVEHAEDWLIGYAQAHDYAGAVMGSHKYNTSENFSSRKWNLLEEQLEVVLLNDPFYSDILTWKKGEAVMRTRKDSCYWLWRADKLDVLASRNTKRTI